MKKFRKMSSKFEIFTGMSRSLILINLFAGIGNFIFPKTQEPRLPVSLPVPYRKKSLPPLQVVEPHPSLPLIPPQVPPPPCARFCAPYTEDAAPSSTPWQDAYP